MFRVLKRTTFGADGNKEEGSPTQWDHVVPGSGPGATMDWVCHPLFNAFAWLQWANVGSDKTIEIQLEIAEDVWARSDFLDKRPPPRNRRRTSAAKLTAVNAYGP